MTRGVRLLCLILSLLSSQWVFATDDGQRYLEKHLADIQSFRASFTQSVLNATLDLVEESRGTMIFQRPGKFRWVYREPYEQEIISDNNTLWIYDKDLEQVSIRPVEKHDYSPIRLLDDPSSIAKKFAIEIVADNELATDIRLTPKSEETTFRNVILTFVDGTLSGMKILDRFDQTSVLLFEQIAMNTDIDNSSFTFTPPKGIDIIHAAE